MVDVTQTVNDQIYTVTHDHKVYIRNATVFVSTKYLDLKLLLGIATGVTMAFLSSFHGLESVVYRCADNTAVINIGNWQQEHKGTKEITFDNHKDNSEVAQELEKTIKILCFILANPKYLDERARHVKKTWGKRCSILLFFSSVTNKTFPTIGLNVSEGMDHLTSKSRQAFKYVYNHYIDDFDWFLKADDDTYVIVENLRYFLKSYSENEPIYFGHHFKTLVKQGYHSGGAGYVLSKEALRRLNNLDRKKCQEDGGAEDVVIGKCLAHANIKTGNSTDILGRSRFHCLVPERHLTGDFPDWYYKYDANGAKRGLSSMSDYAISFHKLKPQEMHAMEYYVYHLRLFGIKSRLKRLNQRRL